MKFIHRTENGKNSLLITRSCQFQCRFMCKLHWKVITIDLITDKLRLGKYTTCQLSRIYCPIPRMKTETRPQIEDDFCQICSVTLQTITHIYIHVKDICFNRFVKNIYRWLYLRIPYFRTHVCNRGQYTYFYSALVWFLVLIKG
jgi:hypothetical protein